jgi:hypothetical protein
MNSETRDRSRRGTWAVLIAFITLCAAALILLPSQQERRRSTTGVSEKTLREMSVSVLIDRLVNVDTLGIGYHPYEQHGSAEPFFIPVDPAASYATDPLDKDSDGWYPPYVPVVPLELREIVSRGLAALPELINHVDDPRETKFRVRTHLYDDRYIPRKLPDKYFDNLFVSIHLGFIYDPRFPEADRRPKGINTWQNPWLVEEERRFLVYFADTYTLKVGDLCYIAIGQIVNRNLVAMDYGGSNVTVHTLVKLKVVFP